MHPFHVAPKIAALLVMWGSAALLIAQATSPTTVEQMLRAGGDALHRRDPVAAEGTFRKVIAAAPGLADGYFGLGLAELREGHADEAAQALGRAVEINPQMTGAHLFLGIAQYQMGQMEAAAGSLRAEVALAPKNVEALSWLGIVEMEAGHPELAAAALDQAAALSPKDENILYQSGKAHSLIAEGYYKQLYQLDPDSALVHRALGESLAAGGQPEKAIEEYQAAVRKQPNNADLYELLGEEDLKVSRNDEANKAFEQALELNPSSGIALYNLGRLKVEGGKPEEGVALLRKAEAHHAMAAPTDFYLGLGLAETGNSAEAVTWLEKCVAAQPSPFIEQSAYFQLARVYRKLGRQADAQHATEQLQKLKAEAAKDITQRGVGEGRPAAVVAGKP